MHTLFGLSRLYLLTNFIEILWGYIIRRVPSDVKIWAGGGHYWVFYYLSQLTKFSHFTESTPSKYCWECEQVFVYLIGDAPDGLAMFTRIFVQTKLWFTLFYKSIWIKTKANYWTLELDICIRKNQKGSSTNEMILFLPFSFQSPLSCFRHTGILIKVVILRYSNYMPLLLVNDYNGK